MMDNVDFIVSASTEVIAGEGTIVTAGGIDIMFIILHTE